MSFFQELLLNTSLLLWFKAFGIIVGTLIIGRLSYRFLTITLKAILSRNQSMLDDILLDRAEEPIVLAMVLGGFWWAGDVLDFTPEVQFYFNKGMGFMVILTVAWFLLRILNGLMEGYFLPKTIGNKSKIDDSLLPAVERVVYVVGWTIAVLIGLSNAGYKINTLVTGLGIGGLAVAIAARTTLINIFGGFTIFILQPFKTNDRIMIDNLDGFVERIGLSVTRLRTFHDKSLVFIPNSLFVEKKITNYTEAGFQKYTYKLHFPIDIEIEKIEKAIQKLRHEVVQKDYLLAESRFNVENFNENGIELYVTVFIRFVGQFDYWHGKNDFALVIIRTLREIDARMVVKSTLKTFPTPVSEGGPPVVVDEKKKKPTEDRRSDE
ncbi:MAG TPA: hypothetical protein DCM08_08270 [Microscillaceae bacterium]|jgi:MscS family membrane protein|nr:hypothetical protein [Microscillaceae bacterium]